MKLQNASLAIFLCLTVVGSCLCEEINETQAEESKANIKDPSHESAPKPNGQRGLYSGGRDGVTLTSCGHSFNRYGGHKIVGGRNAALGEYPWQVSLQTNRFTGAFVHYCGATILNNQCIITAAHCVEGFRPEEIMAVAGVNSVKTRSPGVEMRTRVSKIVSHPEYDPNHLQNDLAIIKSAYAMNVGPQSMSPINGACLPRAEEEFDGDAAVTGWGKTSEWGTLSDQLRGVNVTLMKDDVCRTYYPDKITDTMVCAGFAEGQKDACQGDSGGPLVKDIGGTSVLIGVVSWGFGCARPKNPGVYTQISKYIPWILANCH